MAAERLPLVPQEIDAEADGLALRQQRIDAGSSFVGNELRFDPGNGPQQGRTFFFTADVGHAAVPGFGQLAPAVFAGPGGHVEAAGRVVDVEHGLAEFFAETVARDNDQVSVGRDGRVVQLRHVEIVAPAVFDGKPDRIAGCQLRHQVFLAHVAGVAFETAGSRAGDGVAPVARASEPVVVAEERGLLGQHVQSLTAHLHGYGRGGADDPAVIRVAALLRDDRRIEVDARRQFCGFFAAVRVFGLFLPVRIVRILPGGGQQGEHRHARLFCARAQYGFQLEGVGGPAVLDVYGTVAAVPVGIRPDQIVFLIRAAALDMRAPDAPAHPGAPAAVYPQAGVNFRFGFARGQRVPGRDQVVERFLRFELLRQVYALQRSGKYQRSAGFVVFQVAQTAVFQAGIFPKFRIHRKTRSCAYCSTRKTPRTDRSAFFFDFTCFPGTCPSVRGSSG